MQEFLELSDDALVRSVDSLEKYGGRDDDPVYQRFKAYRSQLCRITWETFTSALGGCDKGEISATGVVQRPLAADYASAFLSILERSAPAPLKRDDFALGYMGNTEDWVLTILNTASEYRQVTAEFTAALKVFLSHFEKEIEAICGHPWRVASIRHFYLKSGGRGGRHTDGWPVSMRKLFIFPSGATREIGTTWFRLRNGEELVLNSDKPLWVMFENSRVDHTLVSSAGAVRPTIEVDLMPARETSPAPFYAGVNGWYPWFPTENSFLEGTRSALTFAKQQPVAAPVPADTTTKDSANAVQGIRQSLLMRALRKAKRMLLN